MFELCERSQARRQSPIGWKIIGKQQWMRNDDDDGNDENVDDDHHDNDDDARRKNAKVITF